MFQALCRRGFIALGLVLMAVTSTPVYGQEQGSEPDLDINTRAYLDLVPVVGEAARGKARVVSKLETFTARYDCADLAPAPASVMAQAYMWLADISFRAKLSFDDAWLYVQKSYRCDSALKLPETVRRITRNALGSVPNDGVTIQVFGGHQYSRSVSMSESIYECVVQRKYDDSLMFYLYNWSPDEHLVSQPYVKVTHAGMSGCPMFPQPRIDERVLPQSEQSMQTTSSVLYSDGVEVPVKEVILPKATFDDIQYAGAQYRVTFDADKPGLYSLDVSFHSRTLGGENVEISGGTFDLVFPDAKEFSKLLGSAETRLVALISYDSLPRIVQVLKETPSGVEIVVLLPESKWDNVDSSLRQVGVTSYNVCLDDGAASSSSEGSSCKTWSRSFVLRRIQHPWTDVEDVLLVDKAAVLERAQGTTRFTIDPVVVEEWGRELEKMR